MYDENTIIIDADTHNKLGHLITQRLEECEKQNSEWLSNNIRFELQMLLCCLTDFAQYDETTNNIVLTITLQNRDRLIGFLLAEVFRDDEKTMKK